MQLATSLSTLSNAGPLAAANKLVAKAVGDTDKYIAQGDAQGVALAAIQGMYQVLQEKDERIQNLGAQLKALENRMAQFEAAGRSAFSTDNPQKLP